MTTDTPVTSREFEMLRTQVSQAVDRVNDIDNHGTRGVTGLQVQMTEIVKDLGELKNEVTALKADVDSRFKDHAQDHRDEIRDRQRGRRWVVGTMVAATLALCAVITLLILLIQTVSVHVGG